MLAVTCRNEIESEPESEEESEQEIQILQQKINKRYINQTETRPQIPYP